MNINDDENVIETVLSPVVPLIKEAEKSINGDSETYKLSLFPFTINLLFGIIKGIKSIGLLVTETKTSPVAKEMDLVIASKSMYSEAFSRYSPEAYRKIFLQLLETLDFMAIPEIKHLGRMLLVDGSLFPAIVSMQWATYKKTAKAIKLQLSFELNRMIPAEFMCTKGNYSERKFLKKILETGATYICDRGYICFNLFKDICEKKAFFIIRGKSVMNYKIVECFTVNIPAKFLCLLEEVKDMKVVFTNDTHNLAYRIVTFTALGELYVLITNRFDLTTYEVIMLYAYRWQVELCFRFLKRTLNGIHLLCHNPKGIQIQFYLYMIGYLLLLSFKQKCEIINETNEPEKRSQEINQNSDIANDLDYDSNPKTQRQYVRGLVSLLGEGLQKYWKIGIHWLTTVRNCLLEPFTLTIVRTIVMQR